MKYNPKDLDEDATKEVEEINKAITADKYYFIRNLDLCTRISSMYFWRFTFYGVGSYLIHFAFMATLTNMYSIGEDRYCKASSGDKWSDKYDATLTILFVFHMIAWVRLVVFLVCVWLGAVLMGLYYILSINCLIGLVGFFMSISALTADCEEAKDVQLLLVLECVYFVVFALFTESMHLIPFLVINKRNNGHFVDKLRESHIPKLEEEEGEGKKKD